MAGYLIYCKGIRILRKRPAGAVDLVFGSLAPSPLHASNISPSCLAATDIKFASECDDWPDDALPSGGDRNACLQLETPKRRFRFCCDSVADAQTWHATVGGDWGGEIERDCK